MIDPKEEERILSDWGLPPATREINADVHVGSAIQKPYASFEHLLARKRAGWTSFEQLQAAVDAAYPNEPQARKLEQGEDGTIYRFIKGHTGRRVADKHGVLQFEVFEERVPVALSQDGAKAATQAGRRTDFFNGWTWVARGEKMERDGNVMAQSADANPNRRVFYEPADEGEQMAHMAAVAATASRIGLMPMPASAAEPADDKPPARKSGGKE